MELKYELSIGKFAETFRSNRTFMELKWIKTRYPIRIGMF